MIGQSQTEEEYYAGDSMEVVDAINVAANVTGYNEDSMNRAAWIESKNGSHEDTFNRDSNYYGSFQIGRTMQAELGMDNEDVEDNFKSAYVYANTAKKKDSIDFNNYDARGLGNSMGLDAGLIDYIKWQQGGTGALEIITSASKSAHYEVSSSNARKAPSGEFASDNKKSMQENILNQLPATFKKSLSMSIEKGSISDAELSAIYLDYTKLKWNAAATKEDISKEDIIKLSGKYIKELLSGYTGAAIGAAVGAAVGLVR